MSWEPQVGEPCWFRDGCWDKCVVIVGERDAMWPMYVKIVVRIGTKDHDGSASLEQLSPMSAVDRIAAICPPKMLQRNRGTEERPHDRP